MEVRACQCQRLPGPAPTCPGVARGRRTSGRSPHRASGPRRRSGVLDGDDVLGGKRRRGGACREVRDADQTENGDRGRQRRNRDTSPPRRSGRLRTPGRHGASGSALRRAWPPIRHTGTIENPRASLGPCRTCRHTGGRRTRNRTQHHPVLHRPRLPGRHSLLDRRRRHIRRPSSHAHHPLVSLESDHSPFPTTHGSRHSNTLS